MCSRCPTSPPFKSNLNTTAGTLQLASRVKQLGGCELSCCLKCERDPCGAACPNLTVCAQNTTFKHDVEIDGTATGTFVGNFSGTLTGSVVLGVLKSSIQLFSNTITSGVASIGDMITYVNYTSGTTPALALSLQVGTTGQLKTFVLQSTAAVGTATLTVAGQFQNNGPQTTLVLTANPAAPATATATANLFFNGTAWVPITLTNATIP